MKRKEFLEQAEALFDVCFSIMQAKNEDYSSVDDALKNFRKRGIPGILTRMEDKISRVEELATKDKEAKVNESVLDTLLDLANYAVIAAIVWGENRSDSDDAEEVGGSQLQLPFDDDESGTAR